MKTLWFKTAFLALFSIAYFTLPPAIVRADSGGTCSGSGDCSQAAADACGGAFNVKVQCCCTNQCMQDCYADGTKNCNPSNCPGMDDE